jgi:hypothetical protein
MARPTPGEDLRSAITSAVHRLREFSAEQAATPVATGKWSPKQIIGHLIDSATNNHRRFVLAQLKDDLRFDGYEQDGWVDAQRYADADWSGLVTLWEAFNMHVAWVMDAAVEAHRVREVTDHNLEAVSWEDVKPGVPVSLDFMMRDYTGHLRNHLRQIDPDLSHAPAYQLTTPPNG